MPWQGKKWRSPWREAEGRRLLNEPCPRAGGGPILSTKPGTQAAAPVTVVPEEEMRELCFKVPPGKCLLKCGVGPWLLEVQLPFPLPSPCCVYLLEAVKQAVEGYPRSQWENPAACYLARC